MERTRIQRLSGIGMLAAIGFLLMFFEFPILPMFSWLKIDFSDVAVILGMYMFGAPAGIMVAFLKALLHFITTGAGVPSLIGDGTVFLASVIYSLPIYYAVRNNLSRKRFVYGSLVGTISLVVIMSLLNLWIVTPLYINLIGLKLPFSIAEYVLIGIAPFNLIKGILMAVVFALIYVPLSPWLKKHMLLNVHSNQMDHPTLK